MILSAIARCLLLLLDAILVRNLSIQHRTLFLRQVGQMNDDLVTKLGSNLLQTEALA